MKDDHAQVAKRLAEKGNVGNDDGLNQLVNLGMVRSSTSTTAGGRRNDKNTDTAGGENDKTQFDAVTHNRSISIVYSSSATAAARNIGVSSSRKQQVVHLLPDPHHDSNKLYGVLRGLPLEQRLTFELEDMGIEEKDCRPFSPSTCNASSGSNSMVVNARRCIGEA